MPRVAPAGRIGTTANGETTAPAAMVARLGIGPTGIDRTRIGLTGIGLTGIGLTGIGRGKASRGAPTPTAGPRAAVPTVRIERGGTTPAVGTVTVGPVETVPSVMTVPTVMIADRGRTARPATIERAVTSAMVLSVPTGMTGHLANRAIAGMALVAPTGTVRTGMTGHPANLAPRAMAGTALVVPTGPVHTGMTGRDGTTRVVGTGTVDPVVTGPSVTAVRTAMTATARVDRNGMTARRVMSRAAGTATADSPVTARTATTRAADSPRTAATSLRTATSARTGTIDRGALTTAVATATGRRGEIDRNPPAGTATVVRVKTVPLGMTGHNVRNRVADTATADRPVTARTATTGWVATIVRAARRTVAAIAPAPPGTIAHDVTTSSPRGGTTVGAVRGTGSAATCPVRSTQGPPRVGLPRRDPLARGASGRTDHSSGVRDRMGATVGNVDTVTAGPSAIWNRGRDGSRSVDPGCGTRMSTPPGPRCRNGRRRPSWTLTCVGISAA